MSVTGKKENFIPGSDDDPDDIFRYPFTVEDNTIEYLRKHGRIMFIIRGPAGTGKDTLAAMLSSKERYPGAVICCADHYFKNTFSSRKRDPQTLRLSHEYCWKKVETSCQKGIHPIIVKNTHMRKTELQRYLDLAADYNYTIIVACTLNKFIISPEILAKSNTKGLDVGYFTNRLKQWQEVVPTILGWFLSPGDSSYLLDNLQTSLDFLLGDGKFCRILNIFENEKLMEHYRAKRLLYAVAECSEKNYYSDLRSYYKSDNVKEHYGQCFTLTVQGFLVTPVSIMAIVHLDTTMSTLHQNNKFVGSSSKTDFLDNNLDIQSLQISSRSTKDNFAKYSRTSPFNAKFKDTSGTTAVLEKWEEDEAIDTKSCTCIHLAHNKVEAKTLPWHLKMSFHKMLLEVADAGGLIAADQFGEFEDNYRYCRLPRNAWILKPPYKISLKSVFTGIYV